jgi:maltoporin
MDERDGAVEQWQSDNPNWIVIGVRPVISTGVNGEALEEIEVQVQNQETGEMLSGTGFTVAIALAMIDYLISQRF